MYGGDEPSVSLSAARPPLPTPPPREVNVDEYLASKTKNKKDPLPIIITTKSPESNSRSDSLFGLSTIRESHDSGSKPQTDDEHDFDQYFKQIEQKKSKKLAPPPPPQSKELKRSTFSSPEEIKTPSTSVSIQSNPFSTSSSTKQSQNMHDSTDDDVDELLGNLEVRSSGKYTHTYIHTHTHASFISPHEFLLNKNPLPHASVCLCAMYFPVFKIFFR